MNAYGECPRCGGWTVEHLKTHSHCWECNYFPDYDPGLAQWKAIEFRGPKACAQRQAEDTRTTFGSIPTPNNDHTRDVL